MAAAVDRGPQIASLHGVLKIATHCRNSAFYMLGAGGYTLHARTQNKQAALDAATVAWGGNLPSQREVCRVTEGSQHALGLGNSATHAKVDVLRCNDGVVGVCIAK